MRPARMPSPKQSRRRRSKKRSGDTPVQESTGRSAGRTGRISRNPEPEEPPRSGRSR